MSATLEETTGFAVNADDHTVADAGRYWAASASRPWVRDMSHWRGQGRWADDATWTAIGQNHLDMVRQMYQLAGSALPTPGTADALTMLEWGPGGGPNALALAPYARRFYGVDVSPSNLDECGRQLASSGFDGFRPVPIPAADPARVLDAVPERSLDLFLCTAVFQHFPSQAYGDGVLGLAARMLKPGGLALVQTRYDDGSDEMRCKTGAYDDRTAVTFTSYRIDDFWQRAEQAGFEPMYVTLRRESLYAYYALRRP